MKSSTTKLTNKVVPTHVSYHINFTELICTKTKIQHILSIFFKEL